MFLILIGCEYAGTTTLAEAFNRRLEQKTGCQIDLIHDRWKLPDTKPHGPELSKAEIATYQEMSPRLTEVVQRHCLFYHTPGQAGIEEDFLAIGMHLEEKIYAPIYHGYGGRDEQGDREYIATMIEQRIVRFIPRPVLVLVQADPDVIRRRMLQAPHPYPLVPDADVEKVSRRFEEEFSRSLLYRRITIDTSNAKAAESAEELLERMTPHLNAVDLGRLALRR